MWLVYAILAAVLWGLNYAIAERILHNISTVTLLALEMLIGGLLFLIISYFTHLKTDLYLLSTQLKIFWLTLIEIIIVLAANFFIVSSIRGKDATVAGIVELIYPLFTILFTWILFRENHVNTQVIIGGGLILLGVFVISYA
jgi:drug/metabolite transporter (DMT)-like permease